ncbi:MAG: leucine-rich repeat protein [Oscillospiraceae bacterium]|nr:leucine-rich repeat protein [Oscillospiraceae bacterium]
MKQRIIKTIAALLSACMLSASAVTVCAFPTAPSNLEEGEFYTLTQLAKTQETLKTDDGQFSYYLARDPHLCANLTQYHGAGGKVVIPDIAGKIRVTGTGIDFSGRDDLTEVHYAGFANITIFADNYEKCGNLETVSFGSGLSDEFMKWYFPDGIPEADYAVRRCNLKKGMFAGCTALASVTLPDTSRSNSASFIGERCFENCAALKEIEIKGKWALEKDAFLGCSSLKKVVFTSEIQQIGDHALGFIRNDADEYLKCDGLTIYGVSGTAAETYAAENGFPFVAVSGEKAAGTGDVNTDGTVDVSDAVLLARFCAEDTAAVMTKEGLNAADCNADNLITNEDVIFILRIIAKLTVPE